MLAGLTLGTCPLVIVCQSVSVEAGVTASLFPRASYLNAFLLKMDWRPERVVEMPACYIIRLAIEPLEEA